MRTKFCISSHTHTHSHVQNQNCVSLCCLVDDTTLKIQIQKTNNTKKSPSSTLSLLNHHSLFFAKERIKFVLTYFESFKTLHLMGSCADQIEMAPPLKTLTIFTKILPCHTQTLHTLYTQNQSTKNK